MNVRKAIFRIYLSSSRSTTIKCLCFTNGDGNEKEMIKLYNRNGEKVSLRITRHSIRDAQFHFDHQELNNIYERGVVGSSSG